MVVLNEILEKTEKESVKLKPITVDKNLEVNYDLGVLLVEDPNILDTRNLNSNKNDYILNLTRDNVQLLFNQVWQLPTDRVEEAIVVKLPPRKYPLPRSKPVPKPKPLTKWQQFAKDKGIEKKKKTKLTWDEQLKKWVPRFGFKRVKADLEKNWVIEVPQNADPMEDQFLKKTSAKGERIAKNELQRLRNIAKARNVKVPRFGILDTDKASSKDLQNAITIAKASTASIGKFQNSLPKEKEARGIASITPGATSRKRKLPPVSGQQEKNENLSIVDSLLNKRPKLNIENAVAKHVRTDQISSSQNENSEFRSKKGKGKDRVKNKSMKPSKGKKPKSGKGGRKRR